MNVLIIKPNEYPRPIEIKNQLEDLQAAVGGYIECVYPFEDKVGLVVNDEGKLMGLPLNRALRDEKDMIYDILAGNFLVVGLTEDDFCSLTPEQMEKYEKLFHQPEAFLKLGKEILSFPIPDRCVKGQEKQAEKSHTKGSRMER